MNFHRTVSFALCAIAFTSAHALDPRRESYHYEYTLYPPEGFSVKKSKALMRADPKDKKSHAIIGADGKFTELGAWYYALGSDPKAFEKWWLGYWGDGNVWKANETPVFKGNTAGNQGHRIIAWTGQLAKMIERDAEFDAPVKAAMMSEEWKRAVEKIIGNTINARGLMQYGDNVSDMAQCFHFIRSKFGALRLRVDNIYTLERAQHLVTTLLTEPWIINEEDRYLAPPNADYLEAIGRMKTSVTGDIRLVKDGRVLWSGGLFSGWKDKPSLHGTWDGLSILNSLFKYYPEPDPKNPKSIFYEWNKLPEEKKAIGKKAIILCSRRLWLDWVENKGPTWCWVANGKPTDEDARPSEAPLLPAYDGYGDNQLGWARQCWEEMFGDPMRNTNDGVQALLAIAHGSVLKKLTMPVGQQVHGRFDYDRDVQLTAIEHDKAALNDAKTAALLRERYGLTIAEAKERIARYYLSAGLPPGMFQRDEAPKLDPSKQGRTANE